MRISQKQAELLAEEIASRIKKESGGNYVSAETRAAVKAFKKKRDSLYKDKERLSKEIEAHEQTLSTVVGKANVSKIRSYYDEDNIISKLEEVNSPDLHVIADKIILRSMFATPETMEEFVAGLVKEFKPKASKAKG